jgi:hypothetical protein
MTLKEFQDWRGTKNSLASGDVWGAVKCNPEDTCEKDWAFIGIFGGRDVGLSHL